MQVKLSFYFMHIICSQTAILLFLQNYIFYLYKLKLLTTHCSENIVKKLF